MKRDAHLDNRTHTEDATLGGGPGAPCSDTRTPGLDHQVPTLSSPTDPANPKPDSVEVPTDHTTLPPDRSLHARKRHVAREHSSSLRRFLLGGFCDASA